MISEQRCLTSQLSIDLLNAVIMTVECTDFNSWGKWRFTVNQTFKGFLLFSPSSSVSKKRRENKKRPEVPTKA